MHTASQCVQIAGVLRRSERTASNFNRVDFPGAARPETNPAELRPEAGSGPPNPSEQRIGELDQVNSAPPPR
jgi:hypothetical protein